MSILQNRVHDWGFFSCCSVRFQEITCYFCEKKRLPDIVDSSLMFGWYKFDKTKDVVFDYFDHYDNYDNIEYEKDIYFWNWQQYENYSRLPYADWTPFVTKYFSPSSEVKTMISNIEAKYNLDYENLCVLFYRGNDKNYETKICEHEEYIPIAKRILRENPHTQFLIQSDETEFIEKMTAEFPQNSFYFKDEIRHMNKKLGTVDSDKTKIDVFSKNYLAITIIMSKCKYLVFGSGNCSIWILLYRGNADNVYQNVNDTWHFPK
jgi:hypothetical protein